MGRWTIENNPVDFWRRATPGMEYAKLQPGDHSKCAGLCVCAPLAQNQYTRGDYATEWETELLCDEPAFRYHSIASSEPTHKPCSVDFRPDPCDNHMG